MRMERSCWVCFASDEDDPSASWVQPCRCRGTTKWVHQNCLQRWIDEKQKGNTSLKVVCPQCNTEYLIIFPKLGPVVYFMDLCDGVIYKICPFLAAGLMISSVYWSGVTYGAVTVMQILGHKEGLKYMEQIDPLLLLLGLPTIPVMLILGKLVHWEDFILRTWRRHSSKIPFLGSIMGESPELEQQQRYVLDGSIGDPVSATRILIGALILPTIANTVGAMFFDRIQSSLQKTILGGLVFIACKGAFKIYYKQKQLYRLSQRKILDFVEPSVGEQQNLDPVAEE
uniref:E3 ubiquitin-protein ligase MARCHF5 n=1 Tax=Strigamia maritima TaxID=126957 RepID=T1ISN4_STRMM